MSRNFGLGSRDMKVAGRIALRERQEKHNLINQSVYDTSSRWNQFVNFLKENGINRMEHIQREHILEFAADQLEKYQVDTVRDRISAINTILEHARGDKKLTINATNDTNVGRQSYIAILSRSISQYQHDSLKNSVSERLAVQLDLQRELGLRFRESCLINSKQVLEDQKETFFARIEDGTKNGRPREVVVSERALKALERAAVIQGEHKSLVPKHQSYIQYSRQCYKEISGKGATFHQERHTFAQEQYRELTGVLSPVAAGIAHKDHHKYIAEQKGISLKEAKTIDKQARQIVSEFLGHSRIGITNTYLG